MPREPQVSDTRTVIILFMAVRCAITTFLIIFNSTFQHSECHDRVVSTAASHLGDFGGLEGKPRPEASYR